MFDAPDLLPEKSEFIGILKEEANSFFNGFISNVMPEIFVLSVLKQIL